MKMILKVCFAAGLLGFAVGALASPTIELKDGSRIQGDIRSFEDGVYTVVSPSIGTLHIAQENVLRIAYDGSATNTASSSTPSPMPDDDLTRTVVQLQTDLARDPEAMKSIMNLQSDPQIQAILSDPAIARAIQEGDFTSLLANPKIQALESNAQLKQLLKQQEP
jgi:hypothetical protein